MARVLKRLFVLVALDERESLVAYEFLSKKLTISSVDILSEEFTCNALRRKSEEVLVILAGIRLFIEMALICLLRSASVLAFQGVWPVSIS